MSDGTTCVLSSSIAFPFFFDERFLPIMLYHMHHHFEELDWDEAEIHMNITHSVVSRLQSMIVKQHFISLQSLNTHGSLSMESPPFLISSTSHMALTGPALVLRKIYLMGTCGEARAKTT